MSELCRSNRLVTLTGSGGCGKTRLALAAATTATSSDAFSETWWVELAPLTETSRVVEHVALALGIPAIPDTDQVAAIARRIGGRRAVLLILDNAEHALASVAELVAALMATCPNLSTLVTSRERLGTSGEFVWRAGDMLKATCSIRRRMVYRGGRRRARNRARTVRSRHARSRGCAGVGASSSPIAYTP